MHAGGNTAIKGFFLTCALTSLNAFTAALLPPLLSYACRQSAKACLYRSPWCAWPRRNSAWGPQVQGVRGDKAMVKSVGDRQIPLLESYGRR